MIQNIFKIVVIIILAVLQLTLMPYLGFQDIWPNLILLAALALMILDFDIESLLVASVGGIILDLTSPLVFGVNTAILVVIVLVVKLLMTKYFTEPNIIILTFFFGLAAIIADCMVMLLTQNFIWLPVMVNGLYSAIIGLLLYRFFEQWFKRQSIIKMDI